MYGFGIPNAEKCVEYASTWVNIPEKKEYSFGPFPFTDKIPLDPAGASGKLPVTCPYVLEMPHANGKAYPFNELHTLLFIFFKDVKTGILFFFSFLNGIDKLNRFKFF